MRGPVLPALCLIALLCLTACGAGAGEPTPTPAPAQTSPPPMASVTPAPTPYNGPVNPLSGMPIDAEMAARRPVAVMLNNLEQALPQLGQSQADIIYEVVAEGGITRILGVYQSVEDVGMIGSIRSARPYYIELALGHDALFIHAGGSDQAYSDLRNWDVDHFDAVRGPYLGKSPESNMMWRDAGRRKENGYEHSVVATGASILAYLPEDLRLEHEEGYDTGLTFADDGTPAGGSPASVVTVPFSNYKTGRFVYDETRSAYLVEEYGAPYVDGNTGEQVAVTNVIVVQTWCRYTGDSLGHMDVDVVGEGDGWFACGGVGIPIRWSKPDRESPMTYTTQAGAPLVLGRGQTYVNVVPLDAVVTMA